MDACAAPDRAGLDIVDLTVEFVGEKSVVRAADRVNLRVRPNETVGVVGESGSGKSVSALAVLRLIPNPPGRIASGHIYLDGEDLLTLTPRAIRGVRGDRVSMIFQEPMTSLNPVFTVGSQVAEVFRIHRAVGRREAYDLALELLEKVGIPDARRRLDEYPHQLSGGMRQRVMIAMALGCEPQVLLADEPTTALDVTIQAQIVELLQEMQQASGSGIVLISHDMGLVAEMCERIAVMYAGRIVEEGGVSEIFAEPLHPYTQGLLHSLPQLRTSRDQPRQTRLPTIPGIVPDLSRLPRGCAFRPRCPRAMPVCGEQAPPFVANNERRVRCWLYADTAAADTGSAVAAAT